MRKRGIRVLGCSAALAFSYQSVLARDGQSQQMRDMIGGIIGMMQQKMQQEQQNQNCGGRNGACQQFDNQKYVPSDDDSNPPRKVQPPPMLTPDEIRRINGR